jgi:hypothetical protein
MNFFVINIINIHQLNLRPFGSSKFLVENSLKKYFFHFSSNKGKKNYVFKQKTNTK